MKQARVLSRLPVVTCVVGFSLWLTGCRSGSESAEPKVSTAWQRREEQAPPPTVYRPRRSRPASADESAGEFDDVIATVNGRPIARRRIVDLLLYSHGAGILEQIIGLETARIEAERLGIETTQEDVDREYERAMARLVDPLAAVTPSTTDRQSAEKVLETVMAQRNVSREELDIVIRRTTYLRRIAMSQEHLTEAQLRGEFSRVYGPRVEVRHIQLATLGEVERVRERLVAGDDFAALATRFSANQASAQAGGLLAPFSAIDEAVPEAFRQAAFSLAVGQVSPAVRTGQWHHLIRLERALPASERRYEDVVGELEVSLRERLADAALLPLFEKLFDAATIEIHDPALKEAFGRKHPNRVH